ncbi:MAG TPA: MFS transporter, partial [Clostridia bacterium]|nr:MFS transporter [Clostridia bacterium]
IGAIRDESELSYGNIRLWGSIGFSVFAYIFGILVDKTSINLVFPAFGIMAILVIVITGRIKDEESTDMITNNIKIKDMKLGRLLKNYSYITFLIFSMVLYIPHKASYSFLPTLFADLGASPGTLGIASSIMAFSEIPIFLFTRKLLRKFKPVHLILTSSVFFLFRQVAYLTATTSTQIILAQLLHGPSFALFLNGAVYYIDSMAPSELKSTAQTFATALYGGISGIIGSYGGGWVIDNLGIRKLYIIGIYAIIIITLLFIASLVIGRSTEHSKPSI